MFSMHGTLSPRLFEALAAADDIWWLMGSDVKAAPTMLWAAAALQEAGNRGEKIRGGGEGGGATTAANQYLLISREVKHRLGCLYLGKWKWTAWPSIAHCCRSLQGIELECEGNAWTCLIRLKQRSFPGNRRKKVSGFLLAKRLTGNLQCSKGLRRRQTILCLEGSGKRSPHPIWTSKHKGYLKMQFNKLFPVRNPL